MRKTLLFLVLILIKLEASAIVNREGILKVMVEEFQIVSLLSRHTLVMTPLEDIDTSYFDKVKITKYRLSNFIYYKKPNKVHGVYSDFDIIKVEVWSKWVVSPNYSGLTESGYYQYYMLQYHSRYYKMLGFVVADFYLLNEIKQWPWYKDIVKNISQLLQHEGVLSNSESYYFRRNFINPKSGFLSRKVNYPVNILDDLYLKKNTVRSRVFAYDKIPSWREIMRAVPLKERFRYRSWR